MKRTELLNTMRPSKQRKAVEMAMQPGGVTAAQMVATLGIPFTNRMLALHVQGVATLIRSRAVTGHVAYHLVTDEGLSADALRAQQARREAFERVTAERDDDEWPVMHADDCDD